MRGDGDGDRQRGLERLAALRPSLLVNTTSVGMGEWVSPIAAEALHADLVVLDAVYAPERTRLLTEAEARGAKTVGGKWMLVHQAVEVGRGVRGLSGAHSAKIFADRQKFPPDHIL